MKTYIVYIEGNKVAKIKAASHNAAEKIAKIRFPNKNISVEYTEV